MYACIKSIVSETIDLGLQVMYYYNKTLKRVLSRALCFLWDTVETWQFNMTSSVEEDMLHICTYTETQHCLFAWDHTQNVFRIIIPSSISANGLPLNFTHCPLMHQQALQPR